MIKHLKARVRTLRYRHFTWSEMRRLRAAWNLQQQRPEVPTATGPVRRLVILPSDPWNLVGAKGDEAMMEAVVSRLKAHVPDLVVGVVTTTDRASEAAKAMGFTPIDAWSVPLGEAAQRIEAFRPDAMFSLGADIMDGYYGPAGVMRILLLADAAARQGVRVVVLGFSFNKEPSPHLQPIFQGLHRAVSLNVRDHISLKRFQSFTSTPAKLVADSAFMLEPRAGAALEAVTQWAASQKAAGRAVLGFNIHPMLVRDANEQQIEALVHSATSALSAAAAARPLAVLLISHDYRVGEGDAVCLAPIYERLSGKLGSRVFYPSEKFAAAQLKAMAGLTEGVITGRMHLAIAAFGVGKPVAALTYQDKFQGLFAHFGFPEEYLLPPAEAMNDQKLGAMVIKFFDERASLQAKVLRELSRVMQNSSMNLEAFGIPADPLSTDRRPITTA